MATEGFCALHFVPPALKVLAEIKTTIFYKAFASSFSDKSFYTLPFKIHFSMTWLSWQAIKLYYFSIKEKKRIDKK